MNQIVLSFDDWSRIQESSVYPYSKSERLNEGLSDFLHDVADFASMGADFILPGSGAAIDLINAIGYFIEANLLKDEVESSSAMASGFIALGSMALPAVLQTIAIKMKSLLGQVAKALTKGASASTVSAASGAASKVLEFLRGIVGSISSISSAIVKKVKEFMQTDVGSFIKKQFGGEDKFSKWIQDFFKKVEGTFNSIMTKIKSIFPDSKTPKITMGDVAKEGIDPIKEKQIDQRVSAILKGFLNRTSEFTTGSKSADTTGVKDVASTGPEAVKANLVNAGYGQKPETWVRALKKRYEKLTPKDVTISGAKGVLVPSGPSSERVYINKRYFQYSTGGFNKGKACTKKGSWKFINLPSVPGGLETSEKPDA